MARPDRILVWLMRLSGCVLVTAFGAAVLPTDWMAATHVWLGLGPFPRSPLVEYLARSISLLYGFHGVLILILATDVQRYRPLIRFVAIMSLTFGAAMTAIDLAAPMPRPWALLEGPPIALSGLLILELLRRGDAA